MNPIDWRELYASNQAVIQRAGGTPSPLPAGLGNAMPQPTATLERSSLRFAVHAPPDLRAGTAVPLVCLLHGCTQDAAEISASTRMTEVADRHGFVVVAPEQDRNANGQGCWNWFAREHQGRGAGEPEAIAATVREVMGTTASWTIDPGRVYLAGLSAGGAMAAILAATYPDLFAAVAVHSGLTYASATSAGAAFSAMANGAGERAGRGDAMHAAMGPHARVMPAIVIHGTADRTVAPVNAEQVLGQFIGANRLAAPDTCGELDARRPTSAAGGRVNGGHPYTQTRWTDTRGRLVHELIQVDGMGHAWSGGAAGRPHSDPRGPDASEAIWDFFAEATSP